MPGGGGGCVPPGVEDGGEALHKCGLDGLVVLDAHALLAIADAQRPGSVDKRVELAYRSGEARKASSSGVVWTAWRTASMQPNITASGFAGRGFFVRSVATAASFVASHSR